MSPLDMHMPPNYPAAVGHNSQACEIEPASRDEAAMAKTEYLRMALQDGIGERLRILHHAAISMSHAEFHAFWFCVMHGDGDGEKIKIGQKRLSRLMDCSERWVRDLLNKMEGDGWFEQRKGQRDARVAAIPDERMQPLLSELVRLSQEVGKPLAIPAAILPQKTNRLETPSRNSASYSRVGRQLPSEARAGTLLPGGTPLPAGSPVQKTGSEPEVQFHRTIEDLNHTKKTPPLPPQQAASGRRWAERDPFGMNPWQAKQHEDVKFNEDFRIEVHNGFEMELLGTLAPVGLDLREVLDEAARWIPRAAPPSELKIAVRSQVTRQAREAKERAELRASRTAPSPQTSRGAPPQYDRSRGSDPERDSVLAMIKRVNGRQGESG